MSRLEELIKELCPDGVEYKRLGEIGNFYGGLTGKSKDDFSNGNAKFISYKNVFTNPALDINTDEKVYVGEDEKQRTLEYGDIIFTGSSENPWECGMSSVLTKHIDENMYLNSFCFILRLNNLSILYPDFAKHLFRSRELRYQIGKTANGVTRYNVSKKLMEKVVIPIPPYEVQEEIAKTLDKFTDYVTELQAELQARKQQYEYYRDALLVRNDNIPMVSLKEIATDMYRGSGIKRGELTDEGIPCVRYGEIYTQYNTWFEECVSHTKEDVVTNPKYFEHGDILFAITGESIDDIAKSVAYMGYEKCLAGGDIVVMKHNQNPRYLAHVLSTSFARMQKSKGKVKSKVVHSNIPSIEKITIPLPSIEIQERYANALDNFEAVCNDLNIGLPAEIEARQKQYEFYRDALLTFAETGTIIAQTLIRLIQYVFGYVNIELENVIFSLNTGLNPRQFFKLNTDDAENYYITIREIQNGKIVPNEKTDRINDEAMRLCNNRSNLERGDVLFSGTGTIGETAIVEETPKDWNIKEGVYAIKPNYHLLDSKYLRYLLMSKAIKTAYLKKVTGGTVKSIPMKELRKIIIPLPSIEQQRKIAELIGQFDSLCNDIAIGLPAEIKARQKQYEYYRDKLLSFDEVN